MPGGMTDLEEHLGSLYLRVHTLAGKASLAKLPIAARVGTTLEALLKRLYRNPKIVTASTLNTAANALRLLEALCQPGTEEKLADDEPVRHFRVGASRFTVGRKPESSLCIPSPTVSREHAELTVVDRGLLLRDLGSTNGTSINGVRIQQPSTVHT